MQANNHLEKGTCDGHGNVGVIEGDEAGVFGEAVATMTITDFPCTLDRSSMKSIEMSTHT
jgi:hypothetical protein